MSTRADLLARVRNNTSRTDKDTLINNVLTEGIKEIAKIHRFRDLEQFEDLVLVEDAGRVDLPSGFMNLVKVVLMDTPVVASFTVTSDKTATWSVDDVVQNHNDGGGANGDDWTGVLTSITATALTVRLTQGSSLSDVTTKDGIFNVDAADEIAGSAVLGVTITVTQDKTGTWSATDVVQNYNSGGGTKGDDWAGTILAITTTSITVAFTSGAAGDVDTDDGVYNVTQDDYILATSMTAAVNGLSGADPGSTNYPVTVRTREEFFKMYPNTAAISSSKPVDCFVDLGSLDLYIGPRAGDEYILRISYVGFPSFAADATEIPLVGLDTALIHYATSEVFASLGMFDDALYWERRFEKSLARAINADGKDSVTNEMEMFDSQAVSPRYPINPWEDPFNDGS